MYVAYYQLALDPFRLTPDPRYLFAHTRLQQVREAMRSAFEQGEGIVVLTGRPGTGKSTLLASFIEEPGPAALPIAQLVSTHLDGEDIMRMVAYQFGIDAGHTDKASLLHAIQGALERHPGALLLVDEAQNLPESALEELRMLTNLQRGTRPLLQLFLVGQPDLQERLLAPAMDQLRQRVAAFCTLEPLDLQDTFDFVLHRLARAGWRGTPALDARIFPLMHRASHGLPRYLCKLCARLLLHGAQEQLQQIDFDNAVRVIARLREESLLPREMGESGLGGTGVFTPFWGN